MTAREGSQRIEWRATVRDRFVDETWRYPVVAGLLSIPYTVLISDFQAGTINGEAVVLAGVLAGLLYGQGTDAGEAVGKRAGLVAGIPIYVWFSREMVLFFLHTSSPLWWQALAVPLAMAGIGLIVAFIVAGGLLGAMVGGWLRRAFLPKSRPVHA